MEIFSRCTNYFWMNQYFPAILIFCCLKDQESVDYSQPENISFTHYSLHWLEHSIIITFTSSGGNFSSPLSEKESAPVFSAVSMCFLRLPAWFPMLPCACCSAVEECLQVSREATAAAAVLSIGYEMYVIKCGNWRCKLYIVQLEDVGHGFLKIRRLFSVKGPIFNIHFMQITNIQQWTMIFL